MRLRTSCPVCGFRAGRTVDSFADGGSFIRIRECGTCGFLFADRELTVEELANLEDDLAAREGPATGAPAIEAGVRSHAFLVDLVRRWIGHGERVLEIGPGFGYGLAALRRASFDAVGVESSAGRRRLAQTISGAAVYPDMGTLPAEMVFRLAVMWHVLEHIDQPVEFLKSIGQHLATGGLVLLQVPSFEHRQSFRRTLRTTELFTQVHLSFFTRMTLAALLRAAGFGLMQMEMDETNFAITATARLRSAA